MSLPSTEASELARRIGPKLDALVLPPPLELRRIEAELTEAIPKAPTSEDQAILYSLRGTVFVLQRKPAAALAEFLKAARLAPRVTIFASNVAAAYIEIGQLDEAEAWLRNAEQRQVATPRSPLLLALTRLTLHHKRGETAAAASTFALAVERAAPANSADQYGLAKWAAVLGREDDAVEFLARFLSLSTAVPLQDTEAIEFIRQNADLDQALLTIEPPIAAAVRAVAARHDAPPPCEAQFPAELALTPPGWETLRRALETPPAPTDDLRRLLNDRQG